MKLFHVSLVNDSIHSNHRRKNLKSKGKLGKSQKSHRYYILNSKKLIISGKSKISIFKHKQRYNAREIKKIYDPRLRQGETYELKQQKN